MGDKRSPRFVKPGALIRIWGPRTLRPRLVANAVLPINVAVCKHVPTQFAITPQNIPWNTPVFCLGRFQRAGRPAPFWWRPAFFKKLKWRPAFFWWRPMTPCYNFYFATNVTVRGNLRGNYACVSLFYSTAFVIVIRLVYKTLWLRYRTVKTWINASYIKTSAIGQSGSILVC